MGGRRVLWLLSAAALLALAAWLMARGDKKREDRAKRDAVQFRHHETTDENRRNRLRRTLVPSARASAETGAGPRERPMPRDPLMVALPNKRGASAVVFEASALKDSPIGRHFLDCLMSENDVRGLEEAKEDFGIDILDDVDRAAVADGVGIVTGDFAGARWDEFASERPPRAYGEAGTIYEDSGAALAVFGTGMVMFGKDATALEDAIDRLEGASPAGAPPIPDYAAYGEIYGVISVDTLADLLPPEDAELAGRLKSAATQIELHVDAEDDVAITADVIGTDEEAARDLGKSLGAALAIGRLKAKSEGDDKLVELLDLARVSPRGDRFAVDVALPMELIQKQLLPCKKPKPGLE